jgi:acyl-CoA synthetase (AMP-forming)/AMP-acid ligase II
LEESGRKIGTILLSIAVREGLMSLKVIIRAQRISIQTDGYKELIKAKGLYVALAELEKALASHPAIVDCAVVGTKMIARL